MSPITPTRPRLNTSTASSASQDTQRPGYDRDLVSPGVVHIGFGGFHRAHQAVYLDDLLAVDDGARAYGICGVNLLRQDAAMAEMMRAQDRLFVVAERGADGQRCRVVGSVVEYLFAPDESEKVLARMADPAVRIVSLTITEGGYCYDPATGSVDLSDDVLQHDIADARTPRSAFGFLAEALRRRRSAGVPPFTVLSCDNVHANGDVARRTLLAFTQAQDPDLAAHVAEDVAFPNAMVDRITPRTAPADLEAVAEATGLHDSWPVVCEPFRQWVVEDHFPQGRPAWERVGVQLVEDVRPYEQMKMRLVNAGHQTISYLGLLLGHADGAGASADPTVRRLLGHYLLHEGAASMPAPPGADLRAYSAAVIERFANPAISDSIERLTMQSSTTLPTFVVPVIRDLVAAGRSFGAATVVVACWARAWEGIDDSGRPISLTDARADDLSARARRSQADPLALISGNPMFGELGKCAEFTDRFTRVLRTMHRVGVRAAVEAELAELERS
ncbi:mannitol dehydrogenase family protein [Nakamurella flavida]|nr:mannitol dehydrogenase family protein [Nakamurella flavida]